jgi:mannitol/fructose-specific phosphotransferase system IIA component
MNNELIMASQTRLQSSIEIPHPINEEKKKAEDESIARIKKYAKDLVNKG